MIRHDVPSKSWQQCLPLNRSLYNPCKRTQTSLLNKDNGTWTQSRSLYIGVSCCFQWYHSRFCGLRCCGHTILQNHNQSRHFIFRYTNREYWKTVHGAHWKQILVIMVWGICNKRKPKQLIMEAWDHLQTCIYFDVFG